MRNKPRDTEKAIKTAYDKVKVKLTTNKKDMPSTYIVVPNENWQSRVDAWDEKLKKRGRRIKRPLNVVQYKRIIETFETVIEIEDE